MDPVHFCIERELNFSLRGELRTGVVRIGRIEYQADRERWVCQWFLSHLHHGTGHIYGGDPLEALCNTLDFLVSFIRESARDGYQVWWREQGDLGGLTFPMLENRSLETGN